MDAVHSTETEKQVAPRSKQFRSLLGETFGFWVVMKLGDKRGKHWYWFCKCRCGTIKEVQAASLTAGSSQSCGCVNIERISSYNPVIPDLTGETVGLWTVLGYAESRYNNRVYFRCRCKCGTLRDVSGSQLAAGLTQSCGCVRNAETARRLTKHGQAKSGKRSPEWRSWNAMIRRCTYESMDDYERYGGKGIVPCKGFRNSFEWFFAILAEKPSATHSLDRIRLEDGYYCGQCEECMDHGWQLNCKWATDAEQRRNQHRNHFMTHDGKTLCVADWSALTGIQGPTLLYRRKKGWSVADTLTTPPGCIPRSQWVI